MPYKIVRVTRSLCRVKKAQVGRPRWFSRKAIPCARARRQQQALYASLRSTRKRRA